MFKNKNVMWTILLIIIFLIFIFLSLTFDVNHPFETLKSVINHYDARGQTHVIMLSRISRVLLACLVGASLALGGFIMQLQYQNDLADPTLLGISDGSALMIVICLLFIFRHQMTVYAYGDAITTPLGMNRLHWYRFFSLIVIILTGVGIAVVGRLSFIGLIVPHIIKLIIGKKYAVAIFYVPILGATLVLMSDYLSRLVNYPFETPVGVLIALIGVPIFLHTIRNGARS